MSELTTEVQSLIDTLDKVVYKELTFIKDPENDWTKMKDFNARKSTHDLHKLLTQRNVNYCKNLFILASKNDDIEEREVKVMLDKLGEFFSEYESKFDYYISKTDLGDMMANIKNSNKAAAIKDELEFQSDITKNVADMRNVMMQISRLQDKTKVVIPIFNDRPVPFFMKEVMENRYPEIKVALEEKFKEK